MDGTEQARLLPTLYSQARTDAKWTLAIRTEPAPLPVEAWDEDSVCGDFLRAVRELQQQPESWRNLELETLDPPLRDLLAGQLQQLSPEEQQTLWQEVAAVGRDLLRGELTPAAAGCP